MSDPPPTSFPAAPSDAAPAAPLAYAAPGGAYRASGHASAAGILAVFAGGLAMAAVVGVGLTALLLWRVRIPDIAVMFVPGIAIGLGVAWLIRRAKVRNRLAAGLIAGFCAAATVAAVVGSLYVVAAYKNRDETRAILVQVYYGGETGPYSPSDWEARVDGYVARPFDLYDRAVLIPAFGRGGPYGFFTGLSRSGKSFLVTSGLLSVVAAVVTIRQTSTRPFCEPCGTWYNAPYTAAVLPGALADPVAVALEADDKEQVRQIRYAWRDAEIGSDFASVQVYRCPRCSGLLADVVIGATASAHTPPRRIDDAMREALRPPEPEARPTVSAEL
jgi:hypothetical protein